MDQSDHISYLLKRYLDNTCTRQEMDALLDYVERHPEDERVMDALREAWEKGGTHMDMDEEDVFTWSEMQRRLQSFPAKPADTYREKFHWKIAASILLMAACLGGFFLWQERDDVRLSGDNSSFEKDVTTSPDEHRLIVLPDGSKVWLNSNSKLTNDPAFNNTSREVTLHGEAFFDIRHDSDRPFIIKTGEVKTIVLGTAFNIRAFPGENAVTVTVSRGKVRVEGENKKGGTITANQQITLNLQSEQIEEQAVDAAAVSQWIINGDLILHDITMGDVEEMLEERYSADIRFDNTDLEKCRFTATFFQHAGLEEVLTAICLVNGATYEIHDGFIIIYGEGCPYEQYGRNNNKPLTRGI